MRTVTETTNNPGLKYTHIGTDSTGVNFYKEEVNTEFYKHRELLQENIDNKQKVIIKKQVEYKLPEVITPFTLQSFPTKIFPPLYCGTCSYTG